MAALTARLLKITSTCCRSMSLSTQKQRVHLSLKKKVEVITTAEKNRTLSLKALGEIFGCGKTQIGKILKNKDGVLASYEANAPGTRVHTQSRSSEYAEVNSMNGTCWPAQKISILGDLSSLKRPGKLHPI